MKKTGYVVKISENYSHLEVLDVSSFPCCELSDLSSLASNHRLDNTGMQIHDCSTCSGCTQLFANKEEKQKFNIVTVFNKQKLRVSVGEKVEYSVSRWNITFQALLFLLLPLITFALTFAFLFYLRFSESSCIFISFSSFLITAISTLIISRMFFFNAFMPKIV